MDFSSAWWVIPSIILFGFVVLFGLLRAITNCWKTVSPSEVAVVSGRKHRDGKGYRVIKGGGFFRIPVIERVDYISLNLMSFGVMVDNVPDKNGVLLSVKGVANVKINSSDDHLHLAIERFLGRGEDEIKEVAKENLEGNLRSIVGNSAVEDLIGNRQTFQSRVLEEAGGDMAKLGLTIDLLNIQDIRDGKGYIESLGRKKTSEVIRDAAVGEAEAKRETDIKSSEARQAGAIATAQAEQKISDANRDRDLAVAGNEAKVAAAQARISIVAQSAVAEEQKELNEKEVAADQARVNAEVGLQESIRRRTEAQLNATTIVEATKKGEARVISAQAEADAAELEGEASRIKKEKEGLGEQARMTAVAEGRVQEARATQAELEAEANGLRAKLVAEAEGTEKKAEAFSKLDEAGRALLIIEALPPVIKEVGEALGKVVTPMAEAIGEGLGNIEEVRIIDFGGRSSSEGGNILSDFMKMPTETLFALAEKARASGTLPALSGLLTKMGIDLGSMTPPTQPSDKEGKSLGRQLPKETASEKSEELIEAKA